MSPCNPAATTLLYSDYGVLKKEMVVVVVQYALISLEEKRYSLSRLFDKKQIQLF
jgi:hypothetical protein